MKTIQLSEATKSQLLEYANNVLGLSIHHATGEEKIRAQIMACGAEEITVSDEPKVVENLNPVVTIADIQAPKSEKVKILISRTDEAGGDEPVPVGVNGRIMLIPRGEVVEIPEPYYEALKNAVYYRYEPLKDGGMPTKPREVPAYPFQRIA